MNKNCVWKETAPSFLPILNEKGKNGDNKVHIHVPQIGDSKKGISSHIYHNVENLSLCYIYHQI